MSQIDSIVDNLKADTRNLKSKADEIRTSRPELIQQLAFSENNLKIVGVDGGFVKRQLASTGIILRRATATCFQYKTGKLISSETFPSERTEPEIIVTSSDLLDRDFQIFGNLKRMEVEIQTAIDAVKNFEPDVLILDGSIVIHPGSVPSRDSEFFSLFEKVSGLLRELYELVSAQDIDLVGAVEDSHGSRFSEFSGLDVRSNDSNFLFHLLNEGEYTTPIRYSDKPDLPSLSEMGEWWSKVYTTYVKVSKHDRPLRLDYLETNRPVVPIVASISKITPDYSYPQVLVEADMRSKLEASEVDVVWKAIGDKLGLNPIMFDLRRNQRPI